HAHGRLEAHQRRRVQRVRAAPPRPGPRGGRAPPRRDHHGREPPVRAGGRPREPRRGPREGEGQARGGPPVVPRRRREDPHRLRVLHGEPHPTHGGGEGADATVRRELPPRRGRRAGAQEPDQDPSVRGPRPATRERAGRDRVRGGPDARVRSVPVQHRGRVRRAGGDPGRDPVLPADATGGWWGGNGSNGGWARVPLLRGWSRGTGPGPRRPYLRPARAAFPRGLLEEAAAPRAPISPRDDLANPSL